MKPGIPKTKKLFKRRGLVVRCYGALAIGADPLADFQRGETVDAVRQAILSLPEHYRKVVALCSLHKMNYEQAAEF